MRVLLDLDERAGEYFVVVSGPDGPSDRPVRWTPGRRLLVAKDEPISDDEASELASSVDAGSATAAELNRYGRLLFDAAFSARTWQRIVADAASTPHLELAIRGRADQEQAATSAMQALRWEALHDGTAPVAAKGAAAGSGRTLSVGIVRLVPPAVPIGPNDSSMLPRIDRIPRVLFAIGSRLTDPRVRPGAEFMGILRHLERKGGSIQPRVLESASVLSLTWELDRFRPDILHVIGHGRQFPVEHCVKLQLQAEPPSTADEYITARQLLNIFDGAGHVPEVVVLSACQTASAPLANTVGVPVPEDPVNALPFAARLVAGGVPVVVAMAGDIADTACRVFTRALTQAIGEGIPLVDAVIKGRRAAFYARPDLDSADWVLPAVFLAEQLPGDTYLVNTAAIKAAKERIHHLDLAWEPVFCGRGEFVDAMDRLLDGDDPLNVLVAFTPDPVKGYGGLRLLRELGARAVRAGRLPILLGPFDQEPPKTRTAVAEALSDKLDEIRETLELLPKPNRIVAEAQAGAKPQHLVRAIREAFDDLVADLPETDPVRASPHPRAVLLCHRVDEWLDALDGLLALLGPQGLSPGGHPVPVVMTGTDTGALAQARLDTYKGAAWAKFAPLDRFHSDDSNPEDILAYQWWLLNPPERTPVYAPKRGVDPSWQGQLRFVMRKSLYDEQELFGFVKASSFFFTSDMDGDMLASYAKAAR